MAYKKGEKVTWNWANGTGTGKIETVYTDNITRKIKSSEIKRNASDDCPAYYIKQDDGNAVLKSHSEVEKA